MLVGRRGESQHCDSTCLPFRFVLRLPFGAHLLVMSLASPQQRSVLTLATLNTASPTASSVCHSQGDYTPRKTNCKANPGRKRRDGSSPELCDILGNNVFMVDTGNPWGVLARWVRYCC